MNLQWAGWLTLVSAAMLSACASKPTAPPETLEPTLVIRTPGSTLWTTAEAEAAAKATAAAAAAAATATGTGTGAGPRTGPTVPATTARNSSTASPAVQAAAARPGDAPGGASSAQPAPQAGAEPAPGVRKEPGAALAPSGTLYFDFNSHEIKPEFNALLEAQSRLLAADPKRRIVLEGHADERGGAEYNLALGQRRAEAVLKALKLLGADEARIEAVSFGDTRPVSREATEEAWAKNRRVEIR